jgi:hypothetical protein
VTVLVSDRARSVWCVTKSEKKQFLDFVVGVTSCKKRVINDSMELGRRFSDQDYDL